MKTCTKCWIEKELTEYYKRWNWLRSKCKSCEKIETTEYRDKNKDLTNKHKAKYRKKNKKSLLLKQKEYLKTPRGREVDRIKTSNRRDKIRNTADGSITVDSTQLLLEEQEDKCFYCQIDLNKEGIIKHLDHTQAICNGGTHTLDNVKWTCSTCNLRKWISVDW